MGPPIPSPHTHTHRGGGGGREFGVGGGANTAPLLPEQCSPAGIPHPLAPTFTPPAAAFVSCRGSRRGGAQKPRSEGCQQGGFLGGLGAGAARGDVPSSGVFVLRPRGKAAPAAGRSAWLGSSALGFLRAERDWFYWEAAGNGAGGRVGSLPAPLSEPRVLLAPLSGVPGAGVSRGSGAGAEFQPRGIHRGEDSPHPAHQIQKSPGNLGSDLVLVPRVPLACGASAWRWAWKTRSPNGRGAPVHPKTQKRSWEGGVPALQPLARTRSCLGRSPAAALCAPRCVPPPGTVPRRAAQRSGCHPRVETERPPRSHLHPEAQGGLFWFVL